MSDDGIKKKILALMAKTTSSGCTEEEAMMASEKVQELLHKYQLNLSDIKLRESICKRESYATEMRAHQPVEYCVVAVNYFCDTKGWLHTDKHGEINFEFFGLEHDALIAMYIIKICDWAIVWGGEDFKDTAAYQLASNRGRIKKDFQIAMAIRLSERLTEMKNAQKKEDKKTTGRDLVVVKSEIVAQGFRELGIHLRSSRHRSRSLDPNAERAGRSAGDRVSLNPGVTRGKATGQLN